MGAETLPETAPSGIGIGIGDIVNLGVSSNFEYFQRVMLLAIAIGISSRLFILFGGICCKGKCRPKR